LENLRNLSVFHNHIKPVKAKIFYNWPHRCRTLNLSNFGLCYLPKDIQLLQSLVELDLSDNQLSSLPPQIGLVSTLQILDLANNQLENEAALAPLVSLDLVTLNLLGNPLPHNLISLSFAQLKESLIAAKPPSTVELHHTKLMIVGKSKVGKTTLANMLLESTKKKKLRKSQNFMLDYTPSDGIAIHEWIPDPKAKPRISFSVWDFAGAPIYNNSHVFFLDERSVFLLVFDLSLNYNKQDVTTWLQMINCSAPKSPVILVGTHADLMSEDDISKISSSMLKDLRRFSNITNFVTVNSFEFYDMDILRETIIGVLKNQPYINQKVPVGYLSLIDLIHAERTLSDPPIIAIEEFEQMIIGCRIESSTQTVAEFLALLGVISYFNDRKLGVGNSVVLDPSWFVKLISTIITTREDGVEKNGKLLHSKLPQVWAEYFPSTFSYLIRLFNRIELAFTVNHSPTQLFETHSLVPCSFPTQRPLEAENFISDDYLALGHGTLIERIYDFGEFIPFGFFSRLLIRLLHFTKPEVAWKTGLLCSSGDQTGLIQLEFGYQVNIKVRGKNPAKLLRVIIENIDLLLSGWYKSSKPDVVVPFILTGHNLHHRVSEDYKFTIETLEQAASEGKSDVMFVSSSESEPVPIPIVSVAPDIILADMTEIVLQWSDLQIEKQIGQGGFGKVYRAQYKGEIVAVKQVEVDAEMKTEAFREFRREVALSSELKHDCIVAMKGVCLAPWSLVMEFMPYGDLYSFLQDPQNEINWKMRMTMAFNIASAIRFLHSFQPKIIHRDLKSPNCLVSLIL
jgi:small GTP-binding protein